MLLLHAACLLVVVRHAIRSTNQINGGIDWTHFRTSADGFIVHYFTSGIRLWTAVILVAKIWIKYKDYILERYLYKGVIK